MTFASELKSENQIFFQIRLKKCILRVGNLYNPAKKKFTEMFIFSLHLMIIKCKIFLSTFSIIYPHFKKTVS